MCVSLSLSLTAGVSLSESLVLFNHVLCTLWADLWLELTCKHHVALNLLLEIWREEREGEGDDTSEREVIYPPTVE